MPPAGALRSGRRDLIASLPRPRQSLRPDLLADVNIRRDNDSAERHEKLLEMLLALVGNASTRGFSAYGPDSEADDKPATSRFRMETAHCTRSSSADPQNNEADVGSGNSTPLSACDSAPIT